MATTRTDERHQPLQGPMIICRLMADKAMHDPDYKAQLEQSAHAHGNTFGLALLNRKIEHNMITLRTQHMTGERCNFRRRPTFDPDGYTDIAKAHQELGFIGTASSSARRALAFLAAEQRIQSDPCPFRLMELPPEIRNQIYRELLIGEGRTIVVSADKAPSMWSQSCKTEGVSAFGLDITPALLRLNKRICAEAPPVLYQLHTFDFGVDVFNIKPFFSQISPTARQNVHGIHMELLRHGTDPPLRIVPGRRAISDTGDAWSDACKYIASDLRVKEISFNINFAIHRDFQRFRWVDGLAEICTRAISHYNSPNEHSLNADLRPQPQSPGDWGTDEYRWEVLLNYLRSKMLR